MGDPSWAYSAPSFKSRSIPTSGDQTIFERNAMVPLSFIAGLMDRNVSGRITHFISQQIRRWTAPRDQKAILRHTVNTAAPASLLGMAAAVRPASPEHIRWWAIAGLVLEVAAGAAAWYFQPDARWVFAIANLTAAAHLPLYHVYRQRGHDVPEHAGKLPFLFFNLYGLSSLVIGGPAAWLISIVQLLVFSGSAFWHIRHDRSTPARLADEVATNKILPGWADSTALIPEHFWTLERAVIDQKPGSVLAWLEGLGAEEVARVRDWRTQRGLQPWPIEDLIHHLPPPEHSRIHWPETDPMAIYALWWLGKSGDPRALPILIRYAIGQFDLLGIAARDALLAFASAGDAMIPDAVFLAVLRHRERAAAAGNPYDAYGDWQAFQVAMKQRPLLNRYDLREYMTQGSHAWLYRAFDRHMQKEVALKIAKPDAAHAIPMLRHEQDVQMSLHTAQARAGGRVVPAVYDAGEISSLKAPYLSMEKIEGVPIKERIQKIRKLDDARRLQAALDMAAQLLSLVSFVHQEGFVHGDLYPLNVFEETQTERLVLLDFARATRLEDEGKPALYGPGLIAWAPEQATERIPGRTADLYAIGRILLETVVDRPLAHGRRFDLEQIFASDNGIPQTLRPLLRKALAHDPAERYQTAEAMLHAILESMLTDSGWPEGLQKAALLSSTAERLGQMGTRQAKDYLIALEETHRKDLDELAVVPGMNPLLLVLQSHFGKLLSDALLPHIRAHVRRQPAPDIDMRQLHFLSADEADAVKAFTAALKTNDRRRLSLDGLREIERTANQLQIHLYRYGYDIEFHEGSPFFGPIGKKVYHRASRTDTYAIHVENIINADIPAAPVRHGVLGQANGLRYPAIVRNRGLIEHLRQKLLHTTEALIEGTVESIAVGQRLRLLGYSGVDIDQAEQVVAREGDRTEVHEMRHYHDVDQARAGSNNHQWDGLSPDFQNSFWLPLAADRKADGALFALKIKFLNEKSAYLAELALEPGSMTTLGAVFEDVDIFLSALKPTGGDAFEISRLPPTGKIIPHPLAALDILGELLPWLAEIDPAFNVSIKTLTQHQLKALEDRVAQLFLEGRLTESMMAAQAEAIYQRRFKGSLFIGNYAEGRTYPDELVFTAPKQMLRASLAYLAGSDRPYAERAVEQARTQAERLLHLEQAGRLSFQPVNPAGLRRGDLLRFDGGQYEGIVDSVEENTIRMYWFKRPGTRLHSQSHPYLSVRGPSLENLQKAILVTPAALSSAKKGGTMIQQRTRKWAAGWGITNEYALGWIAAVGELFWFLHPWLFAKDPDHDLRWTLAGMAFMSIAISLTLLPLLQGLGELPTLFVLWILGKATLANILSHGLWDNLQTKLRRTPPLRTPLLRSV
jgi:serine/threonine protein kinase